MNFSRYLLKRIAFMILVLIGASILSFVLVRIVPGDPARMLLPPQAKQEDIDRMNEKMGLDKPYIEQYLKYISSLLKGDLGFSYHTGRSVVEEFKFRLPATIELSMLSLILAAFVGIWLGVVSAINKNGLVDHASRLFSIGGISAPGFWIGLLCIYVFYYKLSWVPAPTGRVNLVRETYAGGSGFLLWDALVSGNWDLFKDAFMHLLLPVLVLSYSFLAMICRLTRTGMIEVSQQDYIKFAKSCGIKKNRIIWKYSLKNGIRPVLTMLGMFLAQLIGGVVFIETVFNWPGIGRYAVDSINFLDYGPIQGFIIFMALIYVVTNLIVDLIYMVIDPRVQY